MPRGRKPKIKAERLIQEQKAEEVVASVSAPPMVRRDPMKPVSVPIGTRINVEVGMGYGFNKKEQGEKIPPYSRAGLKSKGFLH